MEVLVLTKDTEGAGAVGRGEPLGRIAARLDLADSGRLDGFFGWLLFLHVARAGCSHGDWWVVGKNYAVQEF